MFTKIYNNYKDWKSYKKYKRLGDEYSELLKTKELIDERLKNISNEYHGIE